MNRSRRVSDWTMRGFNRKVKKANRTRKVPRLHLVQWSRQARLDDQPGMLALADASNVNF